MKKAIITIISLVLSIVVIFTIYSANKNKGTLRFNQLTSEQQSDLLMELNTIMGGQCEREEYGAKKKK